METGSGLLFCKDYAVNDTISVRIPTVGEILRDERGYYNLVALVSATPYEMMVQLDEAGIDFTAINEFELFCLLHPRLCEIDTSMVFGGFSFNSLMPARNRETGETVLWDMENGIVYDKTVHTTVCRILRKIHFLPEVKGKPGNEEARKYMIERMRTKQIRAARRKNNAQLEGLIVSLVCTEQYKYDFDGTKTLTIYQFNSCVHQIIHKINYDNIMIGCYAGTVDSKNLSRNDLNWLRE